MVGCGGDGEGVEREVVLVVVVGGEVMVVGVGEVFVVVWWCWGVLEFLSRPSPPPPTLLPHSFPSFLPVPSLECFRSNRYEPYLVLPVNPDTPLFEESFRGYGKNKVGRGQPETRSDWKQTLALSDPAPNSMRASSQSFTQPAPGGMPPSCADWGRHTHHL